MICNYQLLYYCDNKFNIISELIKGLQGAIISTDVLVLLVIGHDVLYYFS